MKKGILILIMSVMAFGESQSNEIEKLSPGLRGLLIQEMQHIEKGMHKLFSNIVKGEYEEIQKTAQDIEDSFIFKKALTKEHITELQTKVSKEFVKMDRDFHETAGKLVVAAEFEEKENIEKYFAKMTNSCIKCHSKFAVHRFNGFSE